MLTIQTWGGWGDVLREISLLPCGGTGAAGLLPPFKVRHLPGELAKVHADAGVPPPEAVRDLLSRSPRLRWDGIGPLPRWQKAVTRGLRACIEPFHPGLFDPQFQWLPQDAIPRAERPTVVVQTHLAGLPTKRWAVDNWRTVLGALRELLPEASIHVLDPAGEPLAGAGIFVENRLTFPQAIRLVENCNLLISVDSWSKYVAAWRKIPQLILASDQRAEYPALTPEALWKYSFRGLHNRPDIQIYGLSRDAKGAVRYEKGTMETFTPEEVLRTIRQAVPPIFRTHGN